MTQELSRFYKPYVSYTSALFEIFMLLQIHSLF